MKSRKGFTLVELMAVVLIVGIMAAAAIPIMKARVDNARWSEAKAGMGSIARALRAHAAKTRSATTSISDLGFLDSDLHGTYFVIDDYSIIAANFTPGLDPELAFTIRCDKPALNPSRWELNEFGTWTSSNP